jgi:hypothetical protein
MTDRQVVDLVNGYAHRILGTLHSLFGSFHAAPEPIPIIFNFATVALTKETRPLATNTGELNFGSLVTKTAKCVVVISIDFTTVTVYPRVIAKIVKGRSTLARRSFILTDKYRSKVTPNTHPTCGRELKTIKIEMINPQILKGESRSLICNISNKSAKAHITQN